MTNEAIQLMTANVAMLVAESAIKTGGWSKLIAAIAAGINPKIAQDSVVLIAVSRG